ncbi:MAG TPA: sulfatase-like hydrolase/transferase [Victivallales bacterium]|nr:sulfatase-like hydrolase/transferase [Victivallales bacterium]HPO90808.1 sulfatase-like hydrolase/transferase [Victivallales bacterium]HRR06402.1 sulfatase-like hydrolase/transferase [Victivallales bacterium]
MNRKNLIVISSDEMRGDVPGFMGNPDCKTPYLDKFAQRGVVFTKHFSVHGKCVPARIAMMTGRYPHTDGIRTVNETNLLKPGDPNLLETLKENGYETAYFGHNHVFENLYHGRNKKGESTPDYHSFTEGYFDHFVKKSRKISNNLPKILKNDNAINMEVSEKTDLTGFSDNCRAEQAIHYIKNIRDKSRPFYMHLNFGAPHPSYSVEEPYFSMYSPEKIKPFTHKIPENAPMPILKMREIRSGKYATEEDFLRIQCVYYGMVTKLDSLIGKVLEAIEEEGLFNNSIIMFWVDHGDFAGQYGLIEKWDTAMQDCILHVPQIIYAPELPCGKRIDSLTEHTDIAPTILEMLNIKIPPQWVIHGESLLPIIRGEKKKDAVFADGGHEDDMIKRFNTQTTYQRKDGKIIPSTHGKHEVYAKFPETMSRTKMVRTEKWKLVIRLRGGNELYDMENDPDELHNLYNFSDPKLETVKSELMLKMIEWCLKTDTDRPFQEKVGA